MIKNPNLRIYGVEGAKFENEICRKYSQETLKGKNVTLRGENGHPSINSKELQIDVTTKDLSLTYGSQDVKNMNKITTVKKNTYSQKETYQNNMRPYNRNLKVKKAWNDIFQALEVSNPSTETLATTKLSFKSVDKLRYFKTSRKYRNVYPPI